MIDVSAAPLAECEEEALLRPVRTDWAPVTADGRGLELEAGEGWRERCEAQGELPLGSAAITDAGELRAGYVIHVAVSSEEGGATARSVAAALENGLRRAEEWGVEELALPLLGAGPGALDPESACRVMAPLLAGFVGRGDGRRVVVSVPEEGARDVAESWWPSSGGGGTG